MNAPVYNPGMMRPARPRVYLPDRTKTPFIAIIPAVLAIILSVASTVVGYFVAHVSYNWIFTIALSLITPIGVMVGAILMGAKQPIGFGVAAVVTALMKAVGTGISIASYLSLGQGVYIATIITNILIPGLFVLLYIVLAVVAFMTGLGKIGSNIPGIVLPFVIFGFTLLSFVGSLGGYAQLFEYGQIGIAVYLLLSNAATPMIPLALGIMGASFKKEKVQPQWQQPTQFQPAQPQWQPQQPNQPVSPQAQVQQPQWQPAQPVAPAAPAATPVVEPTAAVPTPEQPSQAVATPPAPGEGTQQ